MSQASSTISDVPDEIVQNQDEIFIDEILNVNDLFFTNQPNFVPLSISEDEEEFEDEVCETPIDNDDSDLIESRTVDLTEDRCVNLFKSNTCKCSKLYGTPCSTNFNFEHLLEYRQQCMEMTSDELDLTVKVQLSAHRKDVSNYPVSMSKKQKVKERERGSQAYYFGGKKICRETFLFCHGIGKSKLQNIAASLDSHGLRPRVHGNTGRQPKHALSVTDVKHIVHFLEEYTLKNGLPLPGRQPNYSASIEEDKVLLLLPSDSTKYDIWKLYNEAARSNSYREVSISQFKKIWLEQTPHILIMKPATDLCSKCQRFVYNISNAGNMTEEEKTTLLEQYTIHLDKSRQQREFYRDMCLRSKDTFASHHLDQEERGQVNKLDVTQMYSFDFAQQIHYPHHAQEVGPLFFKTPRKCQAFGVCAEGAGEQRFYLIDEAEEVGKGANTVISLLHHYFEHWGYGERHVVLQMDNCPGQNKNNAMIRYGVWRTLTGRHDSVEFSLMEAGHTKFSPDWHFGLWKLRWRHSTAESLDDVAKSVTLSSKSGHNHPQLVNDPVRPVLFYNWSSHFDQFFRKLPSLSQYHHFSIRADIPGVVSVKEYFHSPEKEIHLLKNENHIFHPETLPTVIKPNGLNATRQWYLYDEIRPFCRDTSDTLPSCPKPTCPKPKIVVNSDKRKHPSKQ